MLAQTLYLCPITLDLGAKRVVVHIHSSITGAACRPYTCVFLPPKTPAVQQCWCAVPQQQCKASHTYTFADESHLPCWHQGMLSTQGMAEGQTAAELTGLLMGASWLCIDNSNDQYKHRAKSRILCCALPGTPGDTQGGSSHHHHCWDLYHQSIYT